MAIKIARADQVGIEEHKGQSTGDGATEPAIGNNALILPQGRQQQGEEMPLGVSAQTEARGSPSLSLSAFLGQASTAGNRGLASLGLTQLPACLP